MIEWKADCWQEEKAYDMAKEKMEKLGHPGPYGNPWDLDEIEEPHFDESFDNEESETGVCASDCYSVVYRVEVQSTDGYIGRFRVWITWALDEYGDLIDGSDDFSTIDLEKIEEVKENDRGPDNPRRRVGRAGPHTDGDRRERPGHTVPV